MWQAADDDPEDLEDFFNARWNDYPDVNDLAKNTTDFNESDVNLLLDIHGEIEGLFGVKTWDLGVGGTWQVPDLDGNSINKFDLLDIFLDKTLTPETRCYLCRRLPLFKIWNLELDLWGKENNNYLTTISFMDFVERYSDDQETKDYFYARLNCEEFGFSKTGSNGGPMIDGSPADLLNKGKCGIQQAKSIKIFDLLKEKDVIDLINEYSWYQQFIESIPQELRNLYRFAAFVSNNIGKPKKDKFNITKIDGTAQAHAKEFEKQEKAKINYFEKVPGEWHLQEIFIQELQILKDSLQ